MAAAWGWAFLAITLPSPVLFTWYLVWALPLAWVMPKIARRGMVILSAVFVVTQLVTESSRLPTYLQTVKLPFGHPIAIAVCVWVGADFVRRIRRGTPLEAETDEATFGDAFEAGSDRAVVHEIPIDIQLEEPRRVEDAELLPVAVDDLEPVPLALPLDDPEALPVAVPVDVA
jgi:hypothetical protein